MLDSENRKTCERRPGPFGPAWALLPKDQQPLMIDDDMLAFDAIDRMVDSGFSQLPVRNEGERIIGVFSWKSLGKRVADLRAARGSLKVGDLPVREAMEPARFIGPEVYIDTETDWGDIDYVLVGDETDLLGILCIADVFGRLNDFAEAFVLLYELEHEIRDLIHDVLDNQVLAGLLETMNLPANAARPTTLEECTFSQYRSLICSKSNWPAFEPMFGTIRELVTPILATSMSCETSSFTSAAASRRKTPTASAVSVTNFATIASCLPAKQAPGQLQ